MKKVIVAAFAACLSLAGFATADEAGAAASVRKTTNIPPQPLGTALASLARDRTFQVLYRTEVVGDLRTQGAEGELTVDEAMQRLLQGTRLAYRFLDHQTVKVYSPDEQNEEISSLLGVQGLHLAAVDVADEPGSNKNDDVEEVVVSGRRQDEQRSVKRDSVQIVDAIGRTAIEENAIRSVADLVRQMPGHRDGRRKRPRGLVLPAHPWPVLHPDDSRWARARARRRAHISLNDVAADTLESIEIYKTPSANMVEGGMAGLINLRTREPLSYDGFHLSGMLTGTYDSGMEETRPGGDIILGNAWDTSRGRFGMLVGFTGLRNTFRAAGPGADYRTSSDYFDLNGNGALGDVEDAAVVPTNISTGYQQDGFRNRYSGYTRLQWQPTDALEIRGSYINFDYDDNHYQYAADAGMPSANTAENMNDFTLIPGTNIVANGTFSTAGVSLISLAGLHRRYTEQFELGGKWERGPWRLSADLDYSPTKFRTHTGIPVLSSTDANFTSFITRDSIDGAFGTLDPTDPAAFNFDLFIESWARYEGDKRTQRFDVEYDLDGGPFKALQVGTRFSQAETAQVGGDRVASPGRPATDFLDQLTVNRGYESRVSDWLVYDPEKVGNWADTHQVLGLDGNPPVNPTQDFSLDEKTSALYARGLYELTLGGKVIDGDIGVRAIRTKTIATGFTIAPDGSSTRNEQSGRYTDLLPSFNLRLHLTDTLKLRFSGSKTLTRPSFADLSPVITIGQGGLASGGNPNLQAFNSKGGDATIEWYHSDSGFVFAALFYKELDGFIERRISQENLAGGSVLISRPVNAGSGEVQGFEVGLNERFVFLPGIWSGFGVDANATYTDGEVQDSTGLVSPLTEAPDLMANLGLYFEHGKFSTRINANWRSGESMITVFAPGNTRTWGTDIAIVDASFRYRFNERIEFMTNLGNLTETEYPVIWTRPEFGDLRATSYSDFLRIEVGFRAKF